ncbi:hypothetical protein FRB90_002296, partial [Tulasnella sp. 427]
MLGSQIRGDERIARMRFHRAMHSPLYDWNPIPIHPYLFSRAIATSPDLPFEIKKSLVEDDVTRGFRTSSEYVEVLHSDQIVLEMDHYEGFGYIVGDTKFTRSRHRWADTPQTMFLFGISAEVDVVTFY